MKINERLARVTARIVDSDLLRVPAVVAHGRVVITGAEGSRLHEEVLVAGGLIESGRFSRVKEETVEQWLAAATDKPVPESMRERLIALWPGLADPLNRALKRRAEQRAGSLKKTIAKRCDEEVVAIGKVLDELADSIRKALSDEPVWQQASLFELSDPEREQLRRDREALRAKLEGIPEQKERETAALRRRYADPEPRWFPAAVTFLVPASLAKRN